MRPLLALLLAGCAAHASPKVVLADYLEAEQAGRYAEAHALLAATDRAVRPLASYADEHTGAGPIWLAIARRTTFQYGAPKELEDHVELPVKATHVDPHALEQVLKQVPMRDVSNLPDPPAAIVSWVQDTLDQTALPTVSERILYGLREEDGQWRVWLGLDRQDAAVAAAVRARRAEARGDADAAATAWRELLALPTDPGGVVASLQEEARSKLPTP